MFLCACATPYQQRGFRGGYEDVQTAEDTHFISVDVNGYTSMSTAEMYVQRRALELCPHGFDVVSSSADNPNTATIYTNHGGGVVTAHNVNRPHVSATVRCRADGAVAALGQQGQQVAGPMPPAPLEPPVARRVFAAKLNASMATATPKLEVSTEGDDESTFVVTSTVCGVGDGFLPGLLGPTTTMRQTLKANGFTRVVCRGGWQLEVTDL
jgi:hypothetical protein